EGTQAGEAGVHRPQLVAGPGDLVDSDVAGDVVSPRQVTGVVAALRGQLAGDGQIVAELPDADARPNGEPAAGGGQTHRRVKIAKMGVGPVAFGAHDNKF